MATATTATTGTRSKLADRWPTVVGLVTAAACIVVILALDANEEDFTPGIATMMALYLAAYAIGEPSSVWRAFPVLVLIALVLGPLGADAGVGMTVVLGVAWLWALARGRAREGHWFTVETLGVVLFGGLTIAAVAADSRVAGVLAGAGWLMHGLWDAYHFAKDRIVSRTWSELCAVVDIPVGVTLIVVSIVR